MSALRNHDGLVLFPVNPLTVATYREAFTPSRAKDDPTDAELQVEILLTHRDSRWPTLKAVQRARRATLERFFRAHHVRPADMITTRIEAIKNAVALT